MLSRLIVNGLSKPAAIAGVVLTLATFNLNAAAQDPGFDWAVGYGGTAREEAFDCAVDAAGNVYVTGFFSGTADFDPGPGVVNRTSNGGDDIFIQKLTSAGDLVWAVAFGGTQDDRGSAIAVDSTGDVFVAGEFEGTVDFDPGPGSKTRSSFGSVDAFLVHFDSDGNAVWARSFGGTDFDFGQSVNVKASGSVIVTGGFETTADFDPNVGVVNRTSAGQGDVFVVQLNAAGIFEWVSTIGGTDEEFTWDSGVDASDNVYVVGQAESPVIDYDPGPGTALISQIDSRDAFVFRLDPNGNYEWARLVGGTSWDRAFSVAVDPTGGLVVGGTFVSTVDFDPGPGTAELAGGGTFLLKLTSAGLYEWAHSFGGGTFYSPLDLDSNGNVYFAGYFSGTEDFDPGPGQYELTDAISGIYLASLDASAGFRWALQPIGDVAGLELIGLTADASGNVYTVGHFSGTMDVNPGASAIELTSNGGDDAFVFKYQPASSPPALPAANHPSLWLLTAFVLVTGLVLSARALAKREQH